MKMVNDRVVDEAKMADLEKIIGKPEDHDPGDVVPLDRSQLLTPGQMAKALHVHPSVIAFSDWQQDSAA